MQPRYRLHRVRALSQSFLALRCVKTPFLPLSRYEFENNIVLAWFIYLAFPSPLHYVPDGNVHPPPSAVCAFSERISSRLWHSCIFGTYTFRFRVYATRVLFVCFFLVISERACSLVIIAVCSKRPTVVAVSPFFWENLFVNASC